MGSIHGIRHVLLGSRNPVDSLFFFWRGFVRCWGFSGHLRSPGPAAVGRMRCSSTFCTCLCSAPRLLLLLSGRPAQKERLSSEERAVPSPFPSEAVTPVSLPMAVHNLLKTTSGDVIQPPHSQPLVLSPGHSHVWRHACLFQSDSYKKTKNKLKQIRIPYWLCAFYLLDVLAMKISSVTVLDWL